MLGSSTEPTKGTAGRRSGIAKPASHDTSRTKTVSPRKKLSAGSSSGQPDAIPHVPSNILIFPRKKAEPRNRSVSLLTVTGKSRKAGGRHLNVKCQCGAKLALLPAQVKSHRSCGCAVTSALYHAPAMNDGRDRILSMDPGTSNFYVALLQDGEVVGTYRVRNPIKELKEKSATAALDAFVGEIRALIRVFQPRIVIVERFMARRFSAKIIELVGVMLGLIAAEARTNGAEFKLVPSSQWKNKLKKHLDLDAVYADAERALNLPPHPIDAAFMGVFALHNLTFPSGVNKWLKANLKRCDQELLS